MFWKEFISIITGEPLTSLNETIPLLVENRNKIACVIFLGEEGTKSKL